MISKKLAVCLIVVFASMSVVCISPTLAIGEGDWITSYTVVDTQTGQKLIEADFAISDKPTVYAPVVSGQALTVTFTVNVFTSGSGNLKLSTYMQKPSAGQIWQLIPGDYDFGAGYTPNSVTMEFGWTKGTFEMMCYGTANTVLKATNITLVQLQAAGATDPLDAIKAVVLTAGADEYQNLYNQKEARLQSLVAAGVAPGYIELFGNMLNQSWALMSRGYVNDAIALLNAIPNSGEPMGAATEVVLYPLIAVAGVAAAVLGVMFMRARGKNSYFKLVVEDQIKDLEGLTLRASKTDRTMSSSLDSIKDRLKHLVGM